MNFKCRINPMLLQRQKHETSGKTKVPLVGRHLHPLKYRPDVDGLRAIAVISVVVFHAFPALAPGGYVGVDVFFVISGFLITSLILGNLNQGTFSATDFYGRRIKRIFPALILVLSSCLALGWLDMLPNEFRLLGAHVFAGAGFWVNVTLWREAGYFDPAGIQKPLLHLWSLAIEEQFYLVWPWIVVLAYKISRYVFSIVAAIAVTSLVLNLLLVGVKPVPTFYMLPMRAWELLSGACLIWMAPALQATIVRSHRLNRIMTELPGAVGLLLLLGSFALLDSSQPFPGWRAIPPVAGTMLLLCMGPGAIVNRIILSHRIPVSIGLISYPLYLWHWPALSFPQIVGIDTVSNRVFGIMFALALSIATYWLVERRVRRAGPWMSLILVGLVALVGGTGLLVKHGAVQVASASPELKNISAALDDYIYPANVAQPVLFEGQTFWKEGAGSESLIFWGDSNTEMYFPRARKLARETGKSMIFVVEGGCPPILGSVPKCEAFVQSAFRFALKAPAKTIVLAAQWFGYFNRVDEEERLRQYSSIRRELKELRAKGKTVFVILSIPVGGEFSPKAMTTRHLVGLEVRHPAPVSATVNGKDKPVSDKLQSIANETGALTIDPFQALCRDGFCLTADRSGRLAYRDGGHLRAGFVEENASFIDRVFE